MSWLDFSRWFSKGVELELRGGVNASTGLVCTPDAANDRNDLAVDFLRVLALASIDLDTSATTALDAQTWTEISGTFAAGASNGPLFTLAPSGAGLVWGGTETVRVLVHAQCAFDGAGSGDHLAIGVAVEGTVIGDHGHVVVLATGDTHATVDQLVTVEPGDTVSLQIQNHTDGTDVDVVHLSATFQAIAGMS